MPSNGQLWLSYRAKDADGKTKDRICLHCLYDTTTNQWQEYDLSQITKVNATSDAAPSICGFKGYLYVAWRSPSNGKVYYQRTSAEGSAKDPGGWFDAAKETKHSTNDAPVLFAFENQIYLATLEHSAAKTIYISSSSDGINWSEPNVQGVKLPDGTNTTADSTCAPTFSVDINSDELSLIWVPKTPENIVYIAKVDRDGTTSVETYQVNNPLVNSAVYRPGQQLVFTTRNSDSVVLGFPGTVQTTVN